VAEYAIQLSNRLLSELYFVNHKLGIVNLLWEMVLAVITPFGFCNKFRSKGALEGFRPEVVAGSEDWIGKRKIVVRQKPNGSASDRIFHQL